VGIGVLPLEFGEVFSTELCLRFFLIIISLFS